MTLHALIAAWMAIAFITPAAAAEIYRCGANGSSYSQTPCGDGRRIEIDDARSDEQRAEARRVTERTVALASSLENDRRAEEAAHRPALAGSFNAPVKSASNNAVRSNTSAKKAKTKRLRVPAQPSNRRASKPAPVVVLAQPRG
jgi:hypothetical protein